MSDRQPPGIFTPGFASGKARLVVALGVVVAVVGGLHARDSLMLDIGIGLVAGGGLMDLFARRGNPKLMRVLAVGLLVAVAFMLARPALMWQWMGDLARYANNYLGGK